MVKSTLQIDPITVDGIDLRQFMGSCHGTDTRRFHLMDQYLIAGAEACDGIDDKFLQAGVDGQHASVTVDLTAQTRLVEGHTIDGDHRDDQGV